MVVLECHVDAFGKLKNKTISLRPGLNIITGDNETGKTTIADFLKAMLFGMKEGSAEYAHYLPYEYEGAYGGSLKVLRNGSFYEIIRNFLTGELIIKKTSENAVVESPAEWMRDAVSGFTTEEFEKSGYIAQNAFAKDAERYRNSVEKDAARKKEEEIKEQYLQATEYLNKVRNEYLEKQDESIAANLQETEAKLSEHEQALDNLNKSLPEARDSYDREKRALQIEIRRVDEMNRETGENLKNNMLREKKTLEKYADADEKAVKKSNLPGILLMVAGILGAIAGFFYKQSNSVTFEDFTNQKTLIFLGIAGASLVVFVVGLVLLITTFVKRKKATKALAKREECLTRAEDSEWDYQQFVNGESEAIEKVGNRTEREKDLEQREKNILQEENRMEQLKSTIETTSKERSALMKEYEGQLSIRQEIKAIDIALAAFEKLGNADKSDAERELSADATEILAEMDPNRDSVISVENEVIYVVEKGRRLLFSELSTSSMQQVLMAVRLAILNRVDVQKKLPLIMDETLANLDAERLKNALALLRKCSRQVLLLSCQPREKKTME